MKRKPIYRTGESWSKATIASLLRRTAEQGMGENEMSSCEKCWRDAHRGPQYSVAEEYSRLIDERKDTPCTPEEQAGPDAKVCPTCTRKTLHQYTGEPMCGCPSKEWGGRKG